MPTPQQTTIMSFFWCFLALIGVRLGVDLFVHTDGHSYSAMFLYLEFLHTALFFGWTFLLLGILFAYWARISWYESFSHLIFLYLFIAFPPIIDHLISTHLLGDMRFFSYYLFDGPRELFTRYITFFGDEPHDGITYGTRIMVALATLYLSASIWHRTRSTLRALLGGLSIYTLFFLLGALPSLLTYCLLPSATWAGTVTQTDVARLFTSATLILTQEIESIRHILNKKMSIFYALFTFTTVLIMLWRVHRERFWAVIHNLRPLQMFYHTGLLLAGVALAFLFTETAILADPFSLAAALLLITVILTAWASTVFFNDLADLPADRLIHGGRPLPAGTITAPEYRTLGALTLAFSLLLIPLVSLSGFVFLAAYHACAWLYSMPPLRLKRFPVIATFTAACASLMIVFVGYALITPTHSILHFPLPILFLLLAGLTVALTLKDFRDIRGDRYDGVQTLPVILGEARARLIVGGGIFSAYLAVTQIFAGTALYITALLTGALCYLMITYRQGDAYLTPRAALTHTILLITALFLVISAWLLFVR